ncbi:MAG: N-acetylmuramoyl-L-alanine amidase [Gammaproteobacteria bacterium]|nr:N-acetylmuramoyl-L-alanine amidase [Gammaproteobacteria bacterium]
MLDANNIRYLVVHCSDTPDEENLTARDIHAMHQGFGWHGIGYHRLIQRSGKIEHGRPDFWIGAHVYGHNEETLGVCLIGRSQFTDEQFDSLEQVLSRWLSEYPEAEVVGHRDFSYTDKTCPNFDAKKWWQTLGRNKPKLA